MAKKNTESKSKKPSAAKYLLKLGGALVGGAILGEVISPITGPVSGPAIGVALVGLPVWGFKKAYLGNALVPAVALQALKTASTTPPLLVAKASLSGATAALRAGSSETASVPDEVERARRARQQAGG